VMNFANAFHPGGGVRDGASAQEEALCRCSTLLPCLETPENMEKFYDYHDRTINCLANDDCIYTPDVVVFKTDNASPIIMPENEWYKVDVITCAAPDLRDDWIGSVSDRMLYDIHVKRAKKIFDVAMDHRVDAIVLGAFGCGVFSNNPDVVASAYAEVQQNYMGRLHNIEYAIYHLRGTKSPNYRAFRDAMLEEE